MDTHSTYAILALGLALALALAASCSEPQTQAPPAPETLPGQEPTAMQATETKGKHNRLAGDAAAGKKAKLAPDDPQALALYEGAVEAALPVTLAGTASGEVELELTVQAQPCNDRSCLMPQQLKLRIPLKIAAPKAKQ